MRDIEKRAADGCRLRLDRTPEAVGAARRFIARVLAEHHLSGSLIDRAKLVTSELVTNALRHGQGAVELRVGFPADRIRLEVIDEGQGQVVGVRQQPADETGGWGLQIVDRAMGSLRGNDTRLGRPRPRELSSAVR